jgi:hypothetical protein
MMRAGCQPLRVKTGQEIPDPFILPGGFKLLFPVAHAVNKTFVIV